MSTYDHVRCGTCGRPRDEVGTPCSNCADEQDLLEVVRLVELLAQRQGEHHLVRAVRALAASKRLMQVHDRAKMREVRIQP